MFDITAVGELLIDFTPHSDGRSFVPNPGGAPGNALAAAAKLGCSTALIARVGDDAFGRMLRHAVAEQGIDTRGISADPDVPTTLAFVHLDGDGERSFSFYRKSGADVRLDRGHIPAELVEHCRIFHFGGVSMTDEPSRGATLHALEKAKQAGAWVSFDPNFRPTLWGSEAQAARVFRSVLPYVDILKVSEEELPLLTDEPEVEEATRALTRLGISLVLVTRGPLGAYYRVGETFGSLPTYQVDTVDTTGAGDAFTGAILARVKGLSVEELRRLTQAQLEEMVDFANAAGALATTRMGALAQMPTKEEIAALRKKGTRREN